MALRMKGLEIFFDLCLFINIFFLCLNGIIKTSVIKSVNTIVTLLLLLELIMKIISIPFRKFVRNNNNIFQALILMVCLSEIILTFMLITDDEEITQFLRGFMAILFYRIIKYNKFAVKIMNIASKTLPSYINLIILMFVMILIYGLFAM